MSAHMQEALKRAHQQYIQTAASRAGVDEVSSKSQTMKYIALYRVFKPEVGWPYDANELAPASPTPTPTPTAAAEERRDSVARAAVAAHILESHLSQCPDWARVGGGGLEQHLAAHAAEVLDAVDRRAEARAEDGAAVPAAEPGTAEPPPPPAADEAPAPQPDPRERRYKCVSRAALTAGKEAPKIDPTTGRPLEGEIVGIVSVGELLTVLESDVDFSSAGVQRLHARERGGWVSVFAQDGTELLQQLAPTWGPPHTSSSSMTLDGGGGSGGGGGGGQGVSRDSHECEEPLDRSSLDVHLDPLGQGSAAAEHSTPSPPPESELGSESAAAAAGGRLCASVSSGRYRAMFDFDPEESTDLQLTRGACGNAVLVFCHSVVYLKTRVFAQTGSGRNERNG